MLRLRLRLGLVDRDLDLPPRLLRGLLLGVVAVMLAVAVVLVVAALLMVAIVAAAQAARCVEIAGGGCCCAQWLFFLFPLVNQSGIQAARFSSSCQQALVSHAPLSRA